MSSKDFFLYTPNKLKFNRGKISFKTIKIALPRITNYRRHLSTFMHSCVYDFIYVLKNIEYTKLNSY